MHNLRPQVLRGKAHLLSEVPWPLEYIHLGHDEPAHYNRLIIGDCDTSDTGEKWSIDSILDVSSLDKGYFLGHYGEEQKAVQELIASHIYRRVDQISANLGDKVKLMIYADAWDKQSSGMRDLTLFMRMNFSVDKNQGKGRQGNLSGFVRNLRIVWVLPRFIGVVVTGRAHPAMNRWKICKK